jgi:acyl-CoA thioester hydrolase
MKEFRTDFFKMLGFSYKQIENRGILLPLYEMNCKFKSPARYEDEIVIKTTLKAVTKVRIVFSYVVMNFSNGKILSVGETMHALTNKVLKPINAEKVIPDV